MVDCLILGFNDLNFEEYVQTVSAMGTDSGAYRDLRLAYINYQHKPHRCLDILNHHYFVDKPQPHRRFHNADFLWPVVSYLGTYLWRRGYSFDYVNLPHLEKEKLQEKLRETDPLTVAITTTLYVSPQPVLELVSYIREHNERARIIIGGPYISNQPKLSDEASMQKLMRYLGGDIYVISSEGEAALVEVIGALKGGGDLAKVANIAYREGGRYVMTRREVESNQLAENTVNYQLFPREEIGEFVTLRTAKSCPFNCSFCGFPERAGQYTYLPVEKVEEELNAIREIGGVTTLTFIDDTFNVPKGRFKEILRMMIKNNYGYKWNSFYRSDHGDEETIELMGRAGCEGVFLGVESGSDEMLKRMNKAARRKDYLKAIPLLRQAGISTHANLIVGFPGETFETVQESVDLLEEAQPDFYRAQLWYADPVTPIWKDKDQYGVKGSSFNWEHDTMDYRTACELVDKMFLSVDGSIWLPQNGFEQWSTFYLQRKGMHLDEIKTFLRCFNAVIKESLIKPEKRGTDPSLLRNLEASARFDQPSRPQIECLELFTSKRYVEAQRFWVSEFGETPLSSGIKEWRDGHPEGAAGTNEPMRLEGCWLNSLASQCRTDVSDVILTALSILLSRLNGQEDVSAVLVVEDEAGKIEMPLRIHPLVHKTFMDLAQTVRHKRFAAHPHQIFAAHFLSHPVKFSQRRYPLPTFEVAYWQDSSGPKNEDRLTEILQAYPEIGLIFNLKSGEIDYSLQVLNPRGYFKTETMEMLSANLYSMLEDAGQTPTALIGELGLKNRGERHSQMLEKHAGEAFNF